MFPPVAVQGKHADHATLSSQQKQQPKPRPLSPILERHLAETDSYRAFLINPQSQPKSPRLSEEVIRSLAGWESLSRRPYERLPWGKLDAPAPDPFHRRLGRSDEIMTGAELEANATVVPTFDGRRSTMASAAVAVRVGCLRVGGRASTAVRYVRWFEGWSGFETAAGLEPMGG